MKIRLCRLHPHLGMLDELADRLPLDEQAQARRYVRAEDQGRYILGRTLIRRICAEWTGGEPAGIALRRTATGRPYLVGDGATPMLNFNIAHSGDCVLIVWSAQCAVGVDVEEIARSTGVSWKALAQTAFSHDERLIMEAAAGPAEAYTFYRIWVRKEAVLKAEGLGLSGDLRSFSVVNTHAGETEWPECVVYPPTGLTWSLHEIGSIAGYAACIAAPPGTIFDRLAEQPMMA